MVVRHGGGPAERSHRISPGGRDNEHNNCAFARPTGESIQDGFFEFRGSGSFLRLVARQEDDGLSYIPCPRDGKADKGGRFFFAAEPSRFATRKIPQKDATDTFGHVDGRDPIRRNSRQRQER